MALRIGDGRVFTPAQEKFINPEPGVPITKPNGLGGRPATAVDLQRETARYQGPGYDFKLDGLEGSMKE